MVPHRAIANRIAWMIERGLILPTDRILQKTPIVFDASLWEIFVPLAIGAPVVLAPKDTHRDATALLTALTEQNVTVLQAVPSLLAALAAEPGSTPRTMRAFFSGGEKLIKALAMDLRNRFGVDLCNLYGPTEAAIDTTFWQVSQADLFPEAGELPIGRPLDGVRTEILGPSMQRVAKGAQGILWIGGVNLARGYLENPRMDGRGVSPGLSFDRARCATLPVQRREPVSG